MTKIESKQFISLWSYIYIITILLISLFSQDFNVMLFIIYTIMALPFIYSIEHYVVIALMLSTISYYFTGAYEGIYSIYTILIMLIIIRILLIQKGKMEFNRNSVILIIILSIISCCSYAVSQFYYFNGLFRLLYLLLLSLILGNTIRLKIDVMCTILPRIAGVMIIGYIFSVLINGSIIDGRLTIANSVNTNTFGMSCAQLCSILLTDSFLNKSHKKKNLFLCVAIIILAFLSGSRGAVLACVLTVMIIVIMYEKKNGRLIGTMFRFAVFGTIILMGIYFLFVFFGLDVGRFNVSEVIASGGSRRVLIYESLIPYIIKNGYWKLGYGPGHECSRLVIISLIGWDYAHSHNTFLEAFGELGIIGVLTLVLIFKKALKNIYATCKIYKNAYLFMAMIICLIINGFAESYFFDAILWLLVAISRNKYRDIKFNLNEF
nr:O-antigen ligase family protein [uncultured Lachnoanaerobaculum sp.]